MMALVAAGGVAATFVVVLVLLFCLKFDWDEDRYDRSSNDAQQKERAVAGCVLAIFAIGSNSIYL